MKKKIVLPITLLGCVALLAGCGGGQQSSSGSKPSSSSSEEKKELIDKRTEAFTLVSGEIVEGKFVSFDEDKDYKSMYDAIQDCIVDCEPGSYVYRKGSESKKPLYVKQARSDDYWFYYADGCVADGSHPYLQGDTEWYENENVTRVVASGGYGIPTYQPYSLVGMESKTTQTWNRLPLLDAGFRYDPHAFTGIQDTSWTVKLSQAKIRPSYNSKQKIIPMVNVSTTDSFNWSNQGIYMDIETGNWYYFYGETQSDVKSIEYDGLAESPEYGLIMTSKWNQSNQEYTPEYDVKFELSQIYNEDEESVSNDCTITILDGEKVVKTIKANYEINTMTMRGTHRFQCALDLVPTDEDESENEVLPDYMCGAYFKNILVSEGKGSVRADLTDEEYMGDEDMCCEPGHTYDLLNYKGGNVNDSQTKAILDNCALVDFEKLEAADKFDISFEQIIPEIDRTPEMQNVIDLINKIPQGAEPEDPAVVKAWMAYDKLDAAQKVFIKDIEGLTILEELMA